MAVVGGIHLALTLSIDVAQVRCGESSLQAALNIRFHWPLASFGMVVVGGPPRTCTINSAKRTLGL